MSKYEERTQNIINNNAQIIQIKNKNIIFNAEIVNLKINKCKVIEIQYVLHQRLTSPLISITIHTTTYYWKNKHNINLSLITIQHNKTPNNALNK